MEWGTAKGLAVDLGFDQRINDLRYRQEMQKRQQDQNAAKAKMFSDDIDFQNAANSFDAPRVRAANEKITQEIGDFVSSNPDWETNVQKRMYLKSLKNKVKDNPDVIRAVHSDMNYRELLKDLQEVAKNPQQHDTDMYNDYLSKWDNYLKYGNQNGKDAAAVDGVQPFTYVKPKDFVDLPTTMLKAGSQIKDFDIIGTKYGGYYTKPKPEQIKAIKDSILQEHGRQISVEAKKLGLDSPEKVDQWLNNNIEAGVQKQFKLGDPLGYWEASMKQKELNLKHNEMANKVRQGSYTPWHYLVDEKNNPAGTISTEDFYKVWGSKLPIKAVGTDGSVADLSDMDFKPSGRYVNQGGGTFVLGHVDIPLDVAEQKGMYKQGFWTIDGVTAPYRDSAEEVTITDKEGNPVKAIRYKYNLPINRNDKVAMQKFNVMVDVDKLVPPTKSPIQEDFVSDQGEYGGYKVGSVIQTDKGNFLVTPQGFKKQ